MKERMIKNTERAVSTLLTCITCIKNILIAITFITSIFISLDHFLPSAGIVLNFSTHGNSMDPTIKGNALVVYSTTVPYDDLQVGDIIVFKMPKGLNTATATIHVRVGKVDSSNSPASDVSTGSSASSSDETDETDKLTTSGSDDVDDVVQGTTPEGLYDLENIKYLEGQAILHRIVAIEDATGISGSAADSTDSSSSSSSTASTAPIGSSSEKDEISTERLLITQGDANPSLDRYPVTEEAYMGKMLMSIDYIGDVITVLYDGYYLLVIATVIAIAATIGLRHTCRR